MKRKFTQNELEYLNGNDDFQKEIASDIIIKSCFEKRQTKTEAETQLSLFLGGSVKIGLIDYPVPTMAFFLLLGAVRSPLLFGGKFTQADIDFALYALGNGGKLTQKTIEEFSAESKDLCMLTNTDPYEAYEMIYYLLQEVLTPFERIPSTGSGKPCAYGIEWATGLIACVSKTINTNFEECLYMPFLRLASFAVQGIATTGTKLSERLTVSEKILERTEQLMYKHLELKQTQKEA